MKDAREKILTAGRSLMLERGYNGTTLDDICKKAKITKGALFHHFKDKEDLGLKLLDYHWILTQQMLASTPYAKLTDPLERISAYVDLFVMMGEMPGAPMSCLYGNFTQELSETNAKITRQCAAAFAAWQTQIATDLAAAKRKYPSADFKPAEIAEYFMSIYEGALILVKARKESQILSRAMRHFKIYLLSLFDSNTNKKKRRK